MSHLQPGYHGSSAGHPRPGAAAFGLSMGSAPPALSRTLDLQEKSSSSVVLSCHHPGAHKGVWVQHREGTPALPRSPWAPCPLFSPGTHLTLLSPDAAQVSHKGHLNHGGKWWGHSNGHVALNSCVLSVSFCLRAGTSVPSDTDLEPPKQPKRDIRTLVLGFFFLNASADTPGRVSKGHGCCSVPTGHPGCPRCPSTDGDPQLSFRAPPAKPRCWGRRAGCFGHVCPPLPPPGGRELE